MSELEDKISGILNDPAQMKYIASMAKSLMGGAAQESPPPREKTEDNLLQSIMGGMSKLTAGSEKTAMLRAICPMLDEKRGRKLEKAIRMSEIAGLARNFLKEQGGED